MRKRRNPHKSGSVKHQVWDLMNQSGRTITRIAADARVGYHPLRSFYIGTTISLDADVADKVRKSLTKEGA